MNFDIKVKKILKELYPNKYDFDGDFDGDKDSGTDPDPETMHDPEFDVFDEMLQIIKIFQTYNNIDSAVEVEQKLKGLYDSWTGEVRSAVVRELMNMADQGNPDWDYVANSILSIIVPEADDETPRT